MDPIEVLRQRERLLAVRYGADHAPDVLDGEDLQSDDPADAEHWVQVYTELVDFLRTVGPASGAPLADRTETPAVQERRAMRLERKVHELRLAFWTDRLERLRTEPGAGEPGGR